MALHFGNEVARLATQAAQGAVASLATMNEFTKTHASLPSPPVAGNVEAIKVYISKLMSLPPDTPGLSQAFMTAQGLMQEASERKDAQERKEEIQEQTALAVERIAIDAQKDSLASALNEDGLWTEEERKVFESIDPDKHYKVFKVGADGKFVRGKDGKPVEDKTGGQDLRDDHALLKAWANRDNLSPKAKAALYKRLGLEADGSHLTQEQHERAMAILADAAKNVGGNAAAAADAQGRDADVKKIEKSVEKVVEDIKEIDEHEKAREANEKIAEQKRQEAAQAEKRGDAHRAKECRRDAQVHEKAAQVHEKQKEEAIDSSEISTGELQGIGSASIGNDALKGVAIDVAAAEPTRSKSEELAQVHSPEKSADESFSVMTLGSGKEMSGIRGVFERSQQELAEAEAGRKMAAGEQLAARFEVASVNADEVALKVVSHISGVIKTPQIGV